MIYTYEGCCSKSRHERVCRLAEYEADSTFSCPDCGRPLARVLTAPRVLGNTKPFEAFKSNVDGSIISCDRELREHNKRNNVVNLHDGYDSKAVSKFTERDWLAEQDKERKKDLNADMEQAVQKLNEGYTPQPASEGDLIP